ncbi:hypothetical protein ACWDYH_32965 [Nocardia goodfellowii]|uniref:Uncharacterized protein n=1 Tax=Nocardia goodfellowii TaxID=882446 RepID=A0ABS4QG69_9NOCA|nr:hypothetical protein [Nocardia goodfellowii]MBP2190694.1 hypothetical protein [Nocardia goodfellowii]
MARFLTWLRNNVDGLVALVLAVTVGVLAVMDLLEADKVNAAMLLVLALLATTLLRDRHLSAKAMRDASSVQMLNGPEIGHQHTLARRDTEKWIFKGGTGTYIRAVTLKECVRNARQAQRSLRVRLEILDPTNELLCKTYAEFRASVAPDAIRARDPWTTRRVQQESFATVLAACWYKQQYSPLDIAVGFSSVMTTFRWDLATSCIIITQDNPNTPAMMFERDKPYYRDFSRELDSSFDQAKKVPLGNARDVQLDDPPSVEQVRAVFDALGLPLPVSFEDRDVAEIVRRALTPENPF